MKKDIAQARITKKINRLFPNESVAVKNYLIEVAFITWENLELDYNACHDDGTPHTSTENLNYAVDTIDSYVLQEARKEAK